VSRLTRDLQEALQVSTCTSASPCFPTSLPSLFQPLVPQVQSLQVAFPPVQDYELQADTYRCSLEPALAVSAPKRLRVISLQESIQAQVRLVLAGLSISWHQPCSPSGRS
jgi:hypothetical protein